MLIANVCFPWCGKPTWKPHLQWAMRLLSPFLTRRYLGIIFRTCKRTCSFFSQFLGHRLPMTSRLELGCVRPSVRTSTKSFSDLHLIWYVGRPRPDMRINVTSPNLRSRSRSRSFRSCENYTFLGLSPPFWCGAQNWWLAVIVWDLDYSLSEPDFLISL